MTPARDSLAALLHAALLHDAHAVEGQAETLLGAQIDRLELPTQTHLQRDVAGVEAVR